MSSTIKTGVHREIIQPEGQDRLEHFSHGHPLLPFKLNEGDEVFCKVCKDVCSDFVYGCSRCKFIVHKSCPGLAQEIHHPFHPQHPLTMTLILNTWCNICGLFKKDDFRYGCVKCLIFLDFGCVRMRPSIKYDGHKHLLALLPTKEVLFREDDNSKLCQVCSQMCYENILRCVQCQFNIQFYCHPLLPQTMKHECRIHQLILFRSRPEEDEADASGLFWCHACEEERDGKAPIYYCSKCRFAAHPMCVASEILPLITAEEQMPMGSQNAGQSAAKEKHCCGGDPTLAKFDMDIAEIHAKMDPLIVEQEKLEPEFMRIKTDLKATKKKMAALREKLEVLEGDHALHVAMFIGPGKREQRNDMEFY